MQHKIQQAQQQLALLAHTVVSQHHFLHLTFHQGQADSCMQPEEEQELDHHHHHRHHHQPDVFHDQPSQQPPQQQQQQLSFFQEEAPPAIIAATAAITALQGEGGGGGSGMASTVGLPLKESACSLLMLSRRHWRVCKSNTNRSLLAW